MNPTLSARSARVARDQGGFALATVMIVSMVLSMLAIATVDYAVGSQNISRHDQNWNGALSAAEAGIDDYIFRLGENGNYWQYNAGNLPTDGNKALTQYVPVAGSPTSSQFRYDVDASTIAQNGIVTLTSTGRVGNAARTVRVTLRRRSFLDYLYFTDYETTDPAMYTGTPFTAVQAQTYCALHYYGGLGAQRDEPGRVDFTGDSDANGSYCSDITFINTDKLNGPMHTNDAFMVCGAPQFLGDTSTSWNPVSGLRYRDNCPTSHPVFANPGDPSYAPPLTMPPTNSALKSDTNLGAGGCLYTGPTRIILLANGQMTVRSPFTKNTNNTTVGMCPKNGTGAMPTNGVIYVQNVPSTASDPNFTSGCPYNVNGHAHPLGLPIANDLNTYGCRNGDVFIEGTLKGQLSIASENNIDITANLQYNSGVAGTDLLGLIADNYIEVYHPVNCASGTAASCNLNASFPGETAKSSPFNSPVIQAAMLSLAHSVRVQAWDRGAPLGTLHITGVLAQRYRGPVGTNSSGTIVSGFSKDYNYDQRLKYLSPPFFLDPVASQWGVVTWAENKVPAGY